MLGGLSRVRNLQSPPDRRSKKSSRATNRQHESMKTAVFSTKPYDAKFLVAANASAGHELDFFEEKLSPAYR